MASRRFTATVLAGIFVATGLATLSTPADAAVTVTHRWTKSYANTVIRNSSPLAVNLDGAQDIVVGDHNGNLHALRPDGNPVAGWPRHLGAGIDSSPAAADTDNDGRQEVFIATGTAAAANGRVFSLDTAGNQRWAFQPRDPLEPSTAVFSTPALADVNADGVTDLSVFPLGLEAYSVNARGQVNGGWPYLPDDSVFSSAAIADVDGDGKPDYIIGGDSTPGALVDWRGGVLRAVRGDGSTIWQRQFDDIVWSSPAVGDVDGDGRPEIVVGNGDFWYRNGGSNDSRKLFVLNLDGSIKWVKDLGSPTMSSPTLADVNGDGRLDIIQGTWNYPDGGRASDGKVWVFDGSGNPIGAWNGKASGGGVVIGQITTADLDNDGGQDLLIPTGGGVFIYSGKTGNALASLQGGQAAFQNSPLVTSFDGGATLSVVIAGTKPGNTGIISRYDFPASAKLGNLGWHQWKKDNRKTASWQSWPLAYDPCAPAPSEGYWLTAADGGVFTYCNAPFKGAAAAARPNFPIVGMAKSRTGSGYWQVATDGGVFAYGDAQFLGSTGNLRLNKPIVGMAAAGNRNGYWLVASDGGIFSFGDAPFFGSTGAIQLNKPIVGMAATPTGNGYWLVASDGGIFSFGDAQFFGSTGAIRLNQPVVGMTTTASGKGYWLVASDGGVFTFGDAVFRGSTGNIRLNQPIVGISRNRNGDGYRMVARDGGIFAFNSAFLGSAGSMRLNQPVVAMASN